MFSFQFSTATQTLLYLYPTNIPQEEEEKSTKKITLAGFVKKIIKKIEIDTDGVWQLKIFFLLINCFRLV